MSGFNAKAYRARIGPVHDLRMDMNRDALTRFNVADIRPALGFSVWFLDKLMRARIGFVPASAQASERQNPLVPNACAADLLTPVPEPFG